MSHPVRSSLAAVLLVVALLVCRVPASAGEPAIFRGRVVDFAGDAIKKVSVVLTSADDPSFRVEEKTDRNGFFSFEIENASLGYVATFQRAGFLGISAAITLSAGETIEHTFTMLTQREVDEGKEEILAERESQADFSAAKFFNEGVEALSSGDLSAARQGFEEALELDSAMVEALSALCLVTMRQGDWSAAAGYAKRTLAVDPADARALVASYRANKKIGDDEQASKAAEALRSAGYNDEVAGQIFNEGVDLFHGNNTAEAVAAFEEAAELDPTMKDAHVALAGLYLNQEAFDRAIAASDRALALDPNDEKALTYRFEACLLSGCDRLPEAIESLGAVEPDFVSETINELAFKLFKNNQLDESKELVEQLLALNADDARANYVMGLILVNAGDGDAARSHLKAFLEAAPDDPDADGARALLEAIE